MSEENQVKMKYTKEVIPIYAVSTYDTYKKETEIGMYNVSEYCDMHQKVCPSSVLISSTKCPNCKTRVEHQGHSSICNTTLKRRLNYSNEMFDPKRAKETPKDPPPKYLIMDLDGENNINFFVLNRELTDYERIYLDIRNDVKNGSTIKEEYARCIVSNLLYEDMRDFNHFTEFKMIELRDCPYVIPEERQTTIKRDSIEWSFGEDAPADSGGPYTNVFRVFTEHNKK